MKENEDYELIAHDEDADFWAIRLLTGEYSETVYKYNAISLEDDYIKFSFEVLESPDELASHNNQDLQIIAMEVLGEILSQASEDGSFK